MLPGLSISFATLVELGLLPTKFRLHQNYPNPFNPRTTVQFDLPAASHVTLAIYDIRGRIVRTMVDEVKNIGFHNVVWDGTDDNGSSVSSGLYFYTINAGDYSDIRKMTFIK